VAVTAAALLTQYFAFFLLLAQNLHWLAWRVLPPRDPEAPRAPRAGVWLLVQAAVLALFAPWTPVFLDQLGRVGDGFWIEAPESADLGWIFVVLLAYRVKWLSLSWMLAGAVVLGAAGAFLGGRRRIPGDSGAAVPALPRGPLLLALWLFATVGIAWVLSVNGIRVFHPRSLAVCSPALPVFLAYLLRRVRPRWAGGALVGAVAAVSISGYGAYYGTTHKHNFRGAAARMEAQARPGDAILFEPIYFKPAFDCYYDLDYTDLAPGGRVESPRVWCVFKARWEPADQVRRWLEKQGFRVVSSESVRLLDVVLFERGGS
jgi:hypothetical protein